MYDSSEAERRQLLRTEWGFVEQHARDGLCMDVGRANIAERLMAQGVRHYGYLHDSAAEWLTQVEIDAGRINDLPRTFSGGKYAAAFANRPQFNLQATLGVHG